MELPQLIFNKEYYAICKIQQLRTRLVRDISQCYLPKYKTKVYEFFDKAFIRWFFNANQEGNIQGFYPSRLAVFKEFILYDIKHWYIKCKTVFRPAQSLIDEVKKTRYQLDNWTELSMDPNLIVEINSKVTISYKNQSANGWQTQNRQHNQNIISVSISLVQYGRLKTLLENQNLSNNQQLEFIFILTARYQVLGGMTQHLSIPPNIIKKFDVELFGSPLNTVMSQYCSPFPDIESVFGSQGRFETFEFLPDKIYMANPPYDEELMKNMAFRLIQALDTTPNIIIIVSLPVWDPETQAILKQKVYKMKFDAYDILQTSKYLQSAGYVGKNKHAYYDHNTNKWIAATSSHIMILGNTHISITAQHIINEWQSWCS